MTGPIGNLISGKHLNSAKTDRISIGYKTGYLCVTYPCEGIEMINYYYLLILGRAPVFLRAMRLLCIMVIHGRHEI